MADQEKQNDDLDENFWNLDDTDDDQDIDPVLDNDLQPEVDIDPLTHLHEDIDHHSEIEAITQTPETQVTNQTPRPDDTLTENEVSDTESSAAPQPTNKEKVPTSAFEKLSLVIVAIILVALAAGFLNYINNHCDVQTEDSYATNIPVEGQFASIESITTAWMKKTDDQKAELLLPSATITLDSSNSQSGALRVLFFSLEKNADGSYKAAGDSATLSFTNGKFSNGSSTITVKGTAGIESMAELLGYRDQDEERWTIEIREAGSSSAAANDFIKLGHAPIDPLLTE